MDAKLSFKCIACGYKFKGRSDVRNCPYCGSKNFEEYKAVLAGDLLASVKDD